MATTIVAVAARTAKGIGVSTETGPCSSSVSVDHPNSCETGSRKVAETENKVRAKGNTDPLETAQTATGMHDVTASPSASGRTRT